MNSVEYFLLGCFMVTAIYHTFLFIFYKRDFGALFFALITYSSSLLTIARTGLIPYGEKIILLIFIAVPLFYVEFTRHLYPNRFIHKVPHTINHIIRIYVAILSVFVIVVPMTFFSNQVPMFDQMITLVNGLIIIFIVVQLLTAAIKKESDARILLLGFIILFVTAIAIFIIPNNMFTESNPVGALGILLLYSITLARRYSSAYRQSETLVKQRTKELTKSNAELRRLLEYDGLTNAYSRRFILEKLDFLFADYIKNNRELSIISFDLDYFKQVNDTYGHDAGDKVLQSITSAIKENIHDSDFLGRMGGEEFIVIVSGQNETVACGYAEKIRIAIKDLTVLYDNKAINITCSLGVASANKSMESIDDLLRVADAKLYKAKKNGRNQVMCS